MSIQRQELYRIPVDGAIDLSVELSPGCGELNQFHMCLHRKLEDGTDFSVGYGCKSMPTFEMLKEHIELRLPEFMSRTDEQVKTLCSNLMNEANDERS